MEHRYLWSTCSIIHWTNATENGAACRNTFQGAKLKLRILQHLFVSQTWYNVTSDATYLPQLATRYDLFEYNAKIMFSITF